MRDTVDHVNGLAVVLKDILEGRRGGGDGVKKFVLVLDGVEEQREAQQFLLPALARLGEVVSTIFDVEYNGHGALGIGYMRANGETW